MAGMGSSPNVASRGTEGARINRHARSFTKQKYNRGNGETSAKMPDLIVLLTFFPCVFLRMGPNPKFFTNFAGLNQ